ncbi:MAG: response regulator [Dehalococcoidia bacterium]
MAYRRILVVEDEATLRSIIVRNLTARGCEVREAATVAAALAELATELPELMLLDINLPDRSGWDVLRHLKAEGREVPTAIISAVRVSQDRLDEFKPLCFLPKPFPLEALLRLVTEEEVTADSEGGSVD